MCVFQKYLDQFQTKEVFPDGTEIFLGITLVRKDGEWKQKSAFSKVQGLSNTYSKKKPKNTAKYNEAKDIVKSLDNVEIKEMGEDEW